MIFKLIKVLKSPVYSINYIKYRGNFDSMSDKKYLEMLYKHTMKKKLNLSNPKTFNEKLQWLKLNNREDLYTSLVDKYEVRKFVGELIGDEYLIPLLGVWDSFDEIDFNLLPNKFVLKTTHDSGGVVICKDKSVFNIQNAKDLINSSLEKNYFFIGREFPYKNVKPRIICEKLIENKYGTLPNDYKFNCFHGKVDNVMVCVGRDSGHPKFYFFDSDWTLLKYNYTGIQVPNDFSLEKPERIDEMFSLAKLLSENLPYARIDLYCEDNEIYFGEITFYPQSGFDFNLLPETDLLFGSMIDLNKVKRKE